MYTDGKRNLVMKTTAGASIVATQTPADKLIEYTGKNPVRITGLAAVITTAMTVTSAVITFRYRPLGASSETGAVVIGTLTLPVSGSAIGDCVYKAIDPVTVPAGADIVCALTTASTAGAAVFSLEVEDAFEHPSNNAKMKASA